MLKVTSTSAARWRSVIVIAFAGLLIAACATKTTTASPPAAGGAASAAAPDNIGTAVVMTKSGPDGTYLTDGSGKTLYLFAIDTKGQSMCDATCARYWPPLMTSGAPTAGSGATGSMLTTVARSDGSTQVVYNGHPLYYYLADTKTGDVTGQGVNDSGGLWWLVSPTGGAIMSGAGAGSS
jgi:predicted lipoprotein with Yx(FWY)xxD motif